MRRRIGIMQGRLSPIVDGKIQAFPRDHWREEFAIASEIGFDLIEWVFDADSIAQNPVLTESGRDEILHLQRKYGMAVPGICCDYFMEYPLLSGSAEVLDTSEVIFNELLHAAFELDLQYLEIPMIGKSGVKTKEDRAILSDWLRRIETILQKMGTKIFLELDLSPEDILSLPSVFHSDAVNINYDTGNSAYWQFDAESEMETYGAHIGNVHIKDCTPKDYSVPLGTGNVDFNLVFQKLRDIGYQGDFVLQTCRMDDNYESARIFYNFTRGYVKKFFV